MSHNGLKSALDRQGGKCFYCGLPMEYRKRQSRRPHRPTIDHKVPLCLGGLNNVDNRVAACQRCNEAKGPLTADEFTAVRTNPTALLRAIRMANARAQTVSRAA